MEKHYKSFIIFVIIPILIVTLPFAFSVFAQGGKDTKAYDWYFKPTTDNTRPQAIPEADFINDYDVIYCSDSEQKNLYLTFDAGYENGYHSVILDTLKQKNVTAAFFLDGNFVKSNPELVKRMAEEGHLVCNHSLKHPDMTKLTDFESYKKQIVQWEELVSSLNVTPQKFFRFPAGRFSLRSLEYNAELGLTSVFWSFAYFDWDVEKQPDNDGAYELIYSRIHNGAIILLHSTSKTNSEILGRVIDKLRDDGYTFCSLEDFN